MAFAKRYSDAQTAAVVAAQLDHGLSGAATSAAAARGELPGIGRDLEPFEIPAGTCRDKAGDERRRRHAVEAASAGPDAVLRLVTGEAVAMLERHAARLRKRRRTVTAAEIAELAKAGRAVADLVKASQGGRAVASGNGDAKSDGGESDYLAGLAKL